MKLISAFIGPYDTGLDWWKEGYTLSVGEKVIYRLYEWNDEWAEDTVYGVGIITDKYTDDKTICQGRQEQSGLFLDKLDEQALSQEEIIKLFIEHENSFCKKEVCK